MGQERTVLRPGVSREQTGEGSLPQSVASFLVSFFFLIEVELIHNVVLISAVQQSDSVIHIYI